MLPQQSPRKPPCCRHPLSGWQPSWLLQHHATSPAGPLPPHWLAGHGCAHDGQPVRSQVAREQVLSANQNRRSPGTGWGVAPTVAGRARGWGEASRQGWPCCLLWDGGRAGPGRGEWPLWLDVERKFFSPPPPDGALWNERKFLLSFIKKIVKICVALSKNVRLYQFFIENIFIVFSSLCCTAITQF